MPQLMQHIDEIAREKKRDVLFLTFGDPYTYVHHDVRKNHPMRQQMIDWLTQQNITFYPCFDMKSAGVIIMPYAGDLYLDVPYDEQNADYITLKNYLEDEDGKMKIEGVYFMYLPYEMAMENARDEDEMEM